MNMARSLAPTITSLAADIKQVDPHRIKKFRALPLETRSAVFEQLSPLVQQAILERLSTHETLQLLDHYDLQQTENILARVRDSRTRQRLATQLQTTLKEKAEYFLRFHPKAEMDLLHYNYLILPVTATIKAVATAVAEHCREAGRVPEIFLHDQGRFVGEVAFSDVIERPNHTRLSGLVQPVSVVTYNADISDVVQVFEQTKRGKVVVLDSDGSIIGVIYADDALRLFGSIPAASLYDFAGVAAIESTEDPWWKKVASRSRWLIFNLGTGFLAASVIAAFEATLDELVLLALYMPIVAGMGGNAAAQSLAVTVRGITIGALDLASSWRHLTHELIAGVVNGVMIGSLVAIIASVWNGTPLFGFVVGLAIAGNLVVAALFGTVIPLVLRTLGKDPATSATVFITTATDVLGFLLFLGLATLVLL